MSTEILDAMRFCDAFGRLIDTVEQEHRVDGKLNYAKCYGSLRNLLFVAICGIDDSTNSTDAVERWVDQQIEARKMTAHLRKDDPIG